MNKVSKEIPLSELTLRRYEKPNYKSKRELVKKFCLSLGLLQPGDSRDIIVDIFYILLKSKKPLSCEDLQSKVINLRKKSKLPLQGIAASNIRRQLRRLRDISFVEKLTNNYQISENSNLSEIFNERIEKYLLQSILKRVKEYVSVIDDVFKRKK